MHSFSGRTAWARNLQTPLQVFLRTEKAGSAAVLLGTAVAALAWVNISASSYQARVGHPAVGHPLADAGVSLDLREWVNSGLMTFFFFVFGLEARRRVRPGRTARAGPPGAARGGRPRRAGHPRRHLPGFQRRQPGGSRLGRGDVHGLGVRARDPGSDRAPVPRPGARVPAVGRGRGRPGLAGGDRRRLQQGRRAGPAGHRGRDLRHDPALAPGQDPVRDRLRGGGDRGVDRGPEIRRRPGGRRPGHGAADRRLHAGPDRPGTGQRPVPQLPRAAHPRTRAVSAPPGSPRHCPPTSGSTALPSLDQLRHRPAVRARQRRHPAQRRLPRPRLHLPRHPGHPHRLRRGQAARRFPARRGCSPA